MNRTLKIIRQGAEKCFCLDRDAAGKTKCRVEDVDCHNFLCGNKCCILECEEFARGECQHGAPCLHIRVFDFKNRIPLLDISKEFLKLKD